MKAAITFKLSHRPLTSRLSAVNLSMPLIGFLQGGPRRSLALKLALAASFAYCVASSAWLKAGEGIAKVTSRDCLWLHRAQVPGQNAALLGQSLASHRRLYPLDEGRLQAGSLRRSLGCLRAVMTSGEVVLKSCRRKFVTWSIRSDH